MRFAPAVLLVLGACAGSAAEKGNVSDFCGVPSDVCQRHYVDEHGHDFAPCGSASARSLGGPLFPPGASAPPSSSVKPIVVSSNFLPAQGPARPGRDLMATCARDMGVGVELCRGLTGGDDPDCINMCALAYAGAHAPPRQPLPPEPPAPQAARRASSSAPAPPPHVDPFAFALHDCILRVRDSGGSEPAVCHFDWPLDEMTFGQTHCDAKCALLTEPYRKPAH